jgi:predicted small integral membrane protein
LFSTSSLAVTRRPRVRRLCSRWMTLLLSSCSSGIWEWLRACIEVDVGMMEGRTTRASRLEMMDLLEHESFTGYLRVPR